MGLENRAQNAGAGWDSCIAAICASGVKFHEYLKGERNTTEAHTAVVIACNSRQRSTLSDITPLCDYLDACVSVSEETHIGHTSSPTANTRHQGVTVLHYVTGLPVQP